MIPGVVGLYREDAGPGAERSAEQVYMVECRVDADVREDLACCVLAASAGLLELRRVALTLEDVFTQLTTTEPS